MDLPILGATGPSGSNGGGYLAAIDRKYAVEIITADGELHTLTVKFDRPTDPAGVTDLGALKNFDPRGAALANVARTIHAAHHGTDMGMDPKKVPVVEVAEGGAVFVWRHVTSFRFLGEWDAVRQAEFRARSPWAAA